MARRTIYRSGALKKTLVFFLKTLKIFCFGHFYLEELMKKRFLIFSLMFLALIIVSCGGSSKDNSNTGGDDNGTGDNSSDGSGDNSGDNSGSGGGGGNSDAVCGNRMQEDGEVCDGGAKDCTEIDSGYTGGYAICKADCTGWDKSSCTGTPTDPDDGDTDSSTDPDDGGDAGNTNPGTSDSSADADNSDPRDDADKINYIHLKGISISVDGKNVDVSGTTATITASGVYEIDGTLSDGQILVDVDKDKDDGMVHVVFNGMNVTNSKNSPFAVMGAKDVRIFIVKDTQNSLTDTANYVFTDGADEPNAALYSKSDLKIAGYGTLTVKGSYNDGISSKDDLDIDGATLVVNAKDDGIRGKDSVVIRGGNITVTSGGDGIKSDNTEALTLSSNEDDPYENIRGYIKVKGGKLTVTSTGGDGIHAISYIEIKNGIIDIQSGGGSIIEATSGSSGGWGGGGGPNGGAQQYSGTDSLKGIKASIPSTVTDYENINMNMVYIKISGGTIKVNARDDALHSGGNIEIKGGEVEIASDDDGIHADNELYIINGTVNVTNSFEGLEAWYLTVTGGVTSVFGRDDGWNAAGGADSSASSGGPGDWGGGHGGGSSSTGYLTISGGIHYVKTGSGDVDGIDSNGTLTISDPAVIVVECPISGGMGGSYDADGTTTLTGTRMLGFSTSRSERATNYNVSFNTNSYYGTQNVAFKPTISGNYMQSVQGQQPSQINDVSGYTAQTMPNGVVIYYKQ